jgi:hypothetical protein
MFGLLWSRRLAGNPEGIGAGLAWTRRMIAGPIDILPAFFWVAIDAYLNRAQLASSPSRGFGSPCGPCAA